MIEMLIGVIIGGIAVCVVVAALHKLYTLGVRAGVVQDKDQNEE